MCTACGPNFRQVEAFLDCVRGMTPLEYNIYADINAETGQQLRWFALLERGVDNLLSDPNVRGRFDRARLEASVLSDSYDAVGLTGTKERVGKAFTVRTAGVIAVRYWISASDFAELLDPVVQTGGRMGPLLARLDRRNFIPQPEEEIEGSGELILTGLDTLR